MSSALGMNLMPPTSAFQHGGGLQQPPAPPPPSDSVPQPQDNSTNNTNASELNNSTKENHHGKTNFMIFFREIEICRVEAEYRDHVRFFLPKNAGFRYSTLALKVISRKIRE